MATTAHLPVDNPPSLNHLTPVIVVDDVAACVQFWTDRFGFTKENEVTVGDLDATEAALAGAPVVKARHTTFYGSEEIYVREPGGNTVGFAKFA